MRAACLGGPQPADPASAVDLCELPEPEPREDWAVVDIHAGALNMHDLWMLRGVATPSGGGPHVLGSDGAGTVDGREVVIYPVLPERTPGTSVGHSTLLSDSGHGLLAERVVVPTDNLGPKPTHLSWEEAASLPTAWLTAYRMLFTQARLEPGQTVLVQGAGGGVATAAISLAAAAGAQVVVTSRSHAKRDRVRELGASAALEVGAKLSDLADVVIETVGVATFDHSLRSVAPGGVIVCCGASTGFDVEVNLARVFAREARIVGSTTGTLADFHDLLAFVDQHQITPPIDSTVPLEDVAQQVTKMHRGDAFGKLCVALR